MKTLAADPQLEYWVEAVHEGRVQPDDEAGVVEAALDVLARPYPQTSEAALILGGGLRQRVWELAEDRVATAGAMRGAA
jgi:hypothetical protein